MIAAILRSHNAGGDRDCAVMVVVDADGTITATSTGGRVTAMNSDDYDRRVSIREEIASIIEQSSGEMSLTLVTTASSGSGHSQWVQSGEFTYNFAVPWRDDDGDLNFSMSLNGEELPEDAAIDYQGRTIYGAPDDLVQDHGLGQNSQIDWHVFSTTKEYEGAGTMDVLFVTDVEHIESPGQIWDGYGEGADGRVIALDDIPSLQAGHDWQGFAIGAGHTVAGTLDGVAGAFSCYGGQACGLEIETGGASSGYYPSFGTVVFTPSDGSSPEMFTPTTSAPVTIVDYLAFGTWQYVPEDVQDSDSFDFGVFAERWRTTSTPRRRRGAHGLLPTKRRRLTNGIYVGADYLPDWLSGDPTAGSSVPTSSITSPRPFPVTAVLHC